MANVYIAPEPYAKIEKAVQRRKSYMYRCSACYGEFYFCGMNPNYNYCPRCGRPFVKENSNWQAKTDRVVQDWCTKFQSRSETE